VVLPKKGATLGSTTMAKAEKLSVSIDKDELAWARAHARATGRSMSAVMTEALRERRRTEAMDRLLQALGADEIGAADMSAIRAEIYGK
jgi:hypothetical protein